MQHHSAYVGAGSPRLVSDVERVRHFTRRNTQQRRAVSVMRFERCSCPKEGALHENNAACQCLFACSIDHPKRVVYTLFTFRWARGHARYMIGRSVFSTSRKMGHEALRRERRSLAIVPSSRWWRAGGGLLQGDLLGDVLGVDSMESRLLAKRLRTLWGLSHAGVGLASRVAVWRRARFSSAAEDVSGAAAGRRATTCATAASRGVCDMSCWC
ncbi:hypothetical protein T484DRAFT_2936896 [Baffinella frigidus]|nr:hypothetical protein T484DRAFT_2936896 [Cryptophyta sp. CCMP2293]